MTELIDWVALAIERAPMPWYVRRKRNEKLFIYELIEKIDGVEQVIMEGSQEECEAKEEKLCRRSRALSAIEAMRNPTEAMIDAGENAMGAVGAHECEIAARDIYRAMIDAANI